MVPEPACGDTAGTGARHTLASAPDRPRTVKQALERITHNGAMLFSNDDAEIYRAGLLADYRHEVVISSILNLELEEIERAANAEKFAYVPIDRPCWYALDRALSYGQRNEQQSPDLPCDLTVG